MTLPPSFWITAFVIAASGAVHGEILFSSLDAKADWSIPVNTPQSITPRRLAAGFTTGNAGVMIESVALSLWNPNLDAVSFTLPVRFYDDQAGQPGNALGLFAMISVEPQPEAYDAQAARDYPAGLGGGTLLAPNSTYWLVLEAPEDTPFGLAMRWSVAPGPHGSGMLSSLTQPSKLRSEGFAVAYEPLEGASDFQFALKGAAIPEPATLAMALAGGLGFSLRRTRRMPETTPGGRKER